MSQNNNSETSEFILQDEMIVKDVEAIALFRSEGKQDILRILMENEMNIHDLKNALKMNPGTIKRHLDQLLQYELIVQTREDENSWGVKMKYYRTVARKFKINFEWPN